jgi:hypothetical protein
MLFGVRWHRPVGGFIRHEATLNYGGAIPAADGIVLATAYFADASSGWGTGGSATIAGDFGFLAKRCCTRSR